MQYSGLSNKGMVRGNNEDFYHIPDKNDKINLFVVADGMGGANAGEVASSLTVAGIVTFIKEHFDSESDYALLLRRAVNEANKCVFNTAKADKLYDSMGSTVVCALIVNDVAFIANVGDSRCYILSGNGLSQVSVDHSFVQEMVDKGMLTPEEASHHPQKNLITRAVGVDRFVQTDVFVKKLNKGDKILLASDGLTGMVGENDIKNIISKNENAEETVKALIASANNAGGTDNITAVLIADILR